LADYWQKTVEKWRFTEVGHSEHYNNFGGFYNTSNHPALKADGSIIAWGRSSHGGTSAPSGSGYTNIYSTSAAFAALKADGSIYALMHRRLITPKIIEKTTDLI
jgi:hypothetical protein